MTKSTSKTRRVEAKESHKLELIGLGLTLLIILSFSSLKSIALNKKKVELKPSWSTYSSNKDKFKASFPTKPVRVEQDIALGGAGKIEKWTVVKSEESGKVFLVGFVSTPLDYKLASDSAALEQMAKLIITLDSPSASNNPFSTKMLDYQGVPAIEYEFKSGDGGMISKFRTFYVGRIIYYIGEKATKNNFREFNKFVNSLHISK